MSILGPENISPKLIEYYWCNENIKLKDIVSESAFDENKEKREHLNYEDEYEGVGIIIMEKIDNIISNSEDGSRTPLIYRSIVFKKIMHAYKLGFIPAEPDVLVFINKENHVDARILDWGNYGGVKQSKKDYNKENLYVIIGYLKLTSFFKENEGAEESKSNRGDSGGKRRKSVKKNSRNKRRKSRSKRN